MHDAKATAWQKCRCVTRRCTATVSRPQLIIRNSITNNFVQRRYWIEIWQHKTQYQSGTLFSLTSENVSSPLTIALPGQRLRPARPEGQPAGRAAGSTHTRTIRHTLCLEGIATRSRAASAARAAGPGRPRQLAPNGRCDGRLRSRGLKPV